jgi:serine O-acetyltransferase
MTSPPDDARADPPGLIAQLLEDWRAHDRDWTRPGFRAVAVHRLGNWGKRTPRPLRAPVGALYQVLYRGVRNFYGIELPCSVQLGRRVIFEHQSAIVIHENAHIGDDCFIRQGVALGSRHVSDPQAAPRLASGVNVGAGAKILGAVTIGEGAQIGANAVVLTNVPANKLAVGVPARLSTRRPG